MFDLLVCAGFGAEGVSVSPARAESVPAIHFDPAEGTCNAEGDCSFGVKGWGFWDPYLEENFWLGIHGLGGGNGHAFGRPG
jgi:hypothetical protein